MGYREDEENAYRTYDGIVGRSFRRGTRKALTCLSLGLIKGSDPLSELVGDAAGELLTKTLPRAREKNR